MNKRVWLLKERATGETIDKASNYQEACEMIRLYEKADIKACCFQPNKYEIVCKLEDSNESNLLMNEYQKSAMVTADGIPENLRIIYPALGLAGETGEAIEKIKKVIRNHAGKFSQESRKEIAFELGDIMWYVAVLANNLGFKLSEVAEMNIEKLKDRKERGVINSQGDHR
jgi:NTP pyrophosphatase (non-canonical NTP hydrolase)